MWNFRTPPSASRERRDFDKPEFSFHAAGNNSHVYVVVVDGVCFLRLDINLHKTIDVFARDTFVHIEPSTFATPTADPLRRRFFSFFVCASNVISNFRIELCVDKNGKLMLPALAYSLSISFFSWEQLNRLPFLIRARVDSLPITSIFDSKQLYPTVKAIFLNFLFARQSTS